MSIIKSLSMFFLSFSPLWLSVLFIDGKSIVENSQNICTEIISVSLILFGTLFSLVTLMFAFNPKDRNGAQTYILISAKEEKTITSEFLLSYILPLFAFNFTVWYETVLFLIFFVVFAYLIPIFTIGKFYQENGKIWLPLAIQVHHAVCDGFHVCRFVHELQGLVNDLESAASR